MTSRAKAEITLPKLYLAGKIGRYDWRHSLVPNLRAHLWTDGPIVTPTYSYVGPFFVSCDHACLHGPNQHGAIGRGDACESPFTRQDVISNNNAAIAMADLVFAFISARDAYGTLNEIGYSLGLGKRVVVAFAPAIEPADFWFAALQCAAVYHTVRPCCLEAILSDEIVKSTPRVRTGGLVS